MLNITVYCQIQTRDGIEPFTVDTGHAKSCLLQTAWATHEQWKKISSHAKRSVLHCVLVFSGRPDGYVFIGKFLEINILLTIMKITKW